MKQIIALVEDTTLEDIQLALPEVSSSDWVTTVSTVHQDEGRDVVTHVYRGVRYTTRFADRVRLEIRVYDHAVAEVIDWITLATEVGNIGPTQVWVTPIEAAFEIRAGRSTHAISAAA